MQQVKHLLLDKADALAIKQTPKAQAGSTEQDFSAALKKQTEASHSSSDLDNKTKALDSKNEAETSINTSKEPGTDSDTEIAGSLFQELDNLDVIETSALLSDPELLNTVANEDVESNTDEADKVLAQIDLAARLDKVFNDGDTKSPQLSLEQTDLEFETITLNAKNAQLHGKSADDIQVEVFKEKDLIAQSKVSATDLSTKTALPPQISPPVDATSNKLLAQSEQKNINDNLLMKESLNTQDAMAHSQVIAKSTSGPNSQNPIQISLEVALVSGVEPTVSDTKFATEFSNLLHSADLNKSDAPQFQLSLKSAADSVSNMNDMIQRFSPLMKQHLVMMMNQGLQQAEIQLDPPELGQLMVRVQVQDDTTQVQFQVAQSQTRDLIEQAMPRLREMLQEQGLELGEGQVFQGNSGANQQGESADHTMASQEENEDLSLTSLVSVPNNLASSASGIDYYA